MRFKILLTFSFLLAVFFTDAQSEKKLSRSLQKRLAATADRSSESIPLLIKGDPDEIRNLVNAAGGFYKFSSGGIASVSVPLDRIKDIANAEAVRLIDDTPGKLVLLNDKMLVNNNVTPIHAGAAPLASEYDGTGVILGIIDVGIELDHPDFQNANGDSRVEYIWDQTDSGTPPNNFNYGQEWSPIDIITGNATHKEQPNGFGHGSNVAGIAGGNGLAVNNYMGVAPGAKYVIVSVAFGGNFRSNFADAVAYIFEKAELLGKPCVINASVGSMGGTWDGRDLTSQLIDSMLTEKPGRVLVNAAGNSGQYDFHLGYDVSSDTAFTWFKYQNDIAGTDTDGVYFELLADTSEFKDVNFAFGVDDPASYNYRGQSVFDKIENRMDQEVCEDVKNSNNDVIGTVCTYASLVETDSTTYRLEVFIETDSSNYFWRFITEGSGKFDIWSGNDDSKETGTADMVKDHEIPTTTQMPAISKYKAPDYLKTIVSSWNASTHVISVANYNNREYYTNMFGTLVPSAEGPMGEIAQASSQGPNRIGDVKPDIAATGNFTVTSSFKLLWDDFFSALGGMHNSNTGTSMSAPVVSGIAALYIQKTIAEKGYTPDHLEVKDALILTAKSDNFTTNILPNPSWGYGKVDAYATLNTNIVYGCTDPAAFNYDATATIENSTCIPFVYGCTDPSSSNYDSTANVDDGSCILSGIGELSQEAGFVTNYPNPFDQSTQFHYRIHRQFNKAYLKVNDVMGRMVEQLEVESNAGNWLFDGSDLQAGIYFYHLELDGDKLPAKRMVIY